MNERITEHDEFLITMYHCDHMRFAAFCDESDCERIESLNNTLSESKISQCIENYNRRKFGVTFKECKHRKCLLCNEVKQCDIKKRIAYEKSSKELQHE